MRNKKWNQVDDECRGMDGACLVVVIEVNSG